MAHTPGRLLARDVEGNRAVRWLHGHLLRLSGNWSQANEDMYVAFSTFDHCDLSSQEAGVLTMVS